MVMKIKYLREQAGITQNELASRMGTFQNNVSNWETETALPRTRQLPMLAAVFNCSIDDLFVDGSREVPADA